MPPRKRSRGEHAAEPSPAEEATRGCPLPVELLLEIIARSDAATLIRCSAYCRSLRHEIRRPAFIHRVCHDGPGAAVPPRLLGFLGLDLDLVPNSQPPSFSLAYPSTPAAACLSEKHLAPSLSRSAGVDAGRLASYRTLTSRDGLVLLRHGCWIGMRLEVTMCVYDAMTGKGTFFSSPPDTGTGHGYGSFFYYDKFILLTAADGIGCPFLVLAANFSRLHEGSLTVMVRTFSPPSDSDAGGAWSPATFASLSRPLRYADMNPCDSVAVFRGGLINWLIRGGDQDYYIFTYNVLTATTGWMELPAEVPAECRLSHKLHLLASSPSDGTRLSLLVTDKFKISVWMLLSVGDDGDGASCWARQAVIDTATIVYSEPEVHERHRPHRPTGVDIMGIGILLSHSTFSRRSWSEFEHVEKGLIVLDLETKEMRVVSKKKHTFLYEVDMASQLAAMKNF